MALHHAGFSVPRVLPHERWALTPPFHPCQTKRAIRRRLAGFPARCHRAMLRRRYVLCGTVRDAPHRAGLNPAPHAEACNPALRQTLRGSPPGVTRRVALFLIDSDGVRTFLPSGHLAMARPAITRPARQFQLYRENSPSGRQEWKQASEPQTTGCRFEPCPAHHLFPKSRKCN